MYFEEREIDNRINEGNQKQELSMIRRILSTGG